MSNRIPVAVLAATGSVGQRFIQLLDCHPYFKVVAFTASDRSVGQKYVDACHWILPGDMPEWAKTMVIEPSDKFSLGVPLVFSALPAEIALDVEPKFAAAGVIVCSNASAFRMINDVPILLPESNPELAEILPAQRKNHGWSGGIITNSNCTSTGLTVALKVLQQKFGLDKVLAVSMQALSGAGYPGVASLDILDNIIPFIKGEEEKVESEPQKMLGLIQNGRIVPASFITSAHTNRVAVSDGHMVCVSVATHEKVTPIEVIKALQSYQAPEISRDLPSAPNPVVLVEEKEDRPQPRLDRQTGKGMTTIVGRVRKDPLFGIKFVVLSHNTIRGAAGGSIYNAELLVKLGYVRK